MNRYIKFLIIGCIFATLLFAPSSDVVEEGKEKSSNQEVNGKDGRGWTEASRGWIEGTNIFYPYSTNITVGVGTTTPSTSYKLDVAGSVRITGGIHDGTGFGTAGQVLVTNGSDIYWSSSIPGGSSSYIWNQYSSSQSNAKFWIGGTGSKGKIDNSTAGDTGFISKVTGAAYSDGVGIYTRCWPYDNYGIGLIAEGGWYSGKFLSASWGIYSKSTGSSSIALRGVQGTAGEYTPSGSAAIIANGYYGGLFATASKLGGDNSVGVYGVGDSTTTLISSSVAGGAGVVGVGRRGVVGGFPGSDYYGVLGYSARYANLFYQYDTSTSTVDGRSALYAQRGRQYTNHGTGYDFSHTNQAIQGYIVQPDSYSFAISGHSSVSTFYYRVGGVLGATSTSTWGCLGYWNSSGSPYGGYFTSTGSGSGKDGIGIGSYGDLLGGWIKGEEYGLYASGKRYALYLDGNEYANGYVASLQETDNKVNVLYALTSSSVNILAYGRGNLNNGNALIRFEESFSRVVSDKEPITVIITPMGECNQICISRVSPEGFSVYESKGGRTNTEFCYIAIGKRKGYENVQVPEEIADRNFKDNMSKVTWNESSRKGVAQPVWFDGSKLKFEKPPFTEIKQDPKILKEIIAPELKPPPKLTIRKPDDRLLPVQGN
uniref:GLUG domain-containing protein n=1 Tax=candidate division WOR-3 bacterium TaxID=2052148 RepID=A0A7C4TCR1_UNCW3